MSNAITAKENLPTPDTIGKQAATIPVELSTRFLEHFSEQLYSSPQKAFEELISNGWDAGAKCVDVRVSEDLAGTGATMCVFDDGISMDEAGLRELWHIAFSSKRDKPVQFGRAVIGKLSILIPDLVGVEGEDKIVINASAAHVADAIKSQLEKLHSDEPAGENEISTKE